MNWLRYDGIEGRSAMCLVESSVQVGITGWNADVSYSLLYENTSSKTLQNVNFTFPVDESCSVYRLVAELNDRTIECECREKTEARATYRAAVDAGYSAALASEVDGSSDLMECHLGNVVSGARVKINMSAVVELETPCSGKVRLTIPRVLVPRYEPADTPPTKVACSATLENVTHPWLACLQLSGRVTGLPALRGVKCSQGQLQWKAERAEFEVTKLECDCDIELVAEFEPPISGALMTREARSAAESESAFFRQEVAQFTAFLDEAVLSKVHDPAVNEFIIIVDRSGSMSGSNMRSAREALLLFLKSLPSGCKFNVVSFGSSFTQLFSSSKTYSQQTLTEAVRLQETMSADMGGTEILPALRWAFDSRDPSCQLRLFLLTDGEVSNSDQVKDLVLSKCTGGGSACRLSAIGIGHGASTALVKGVSRVGGGRADFVRDGEAEQLRSAVISQLKTAQIAVLENLRLDASTPDGKSVLLGTVPTDPPPSGGAVPIAARLSRFLLLAPEAASKTVRTVVKFSVSGRDFEIECVSDADSDEASQLLHRAVARLQLKEWSDSNANGEHTRSIIELSMATNLVSAHTAFVGIDRSTKQPVPTVERKQDKPKELYCTPPSAGAYAMANVYDPTIEDSFYGFSSPELAVCSQDEHFDMGARSKPKKKGGFSFGLPSLSSLFSRRQRSAGAPAALTAESKKEREKPNSKKKCGMAPMSSNLLDTEYSYATCTSVRNCIPERTPNPSGGDPIMLIAEAQQFDGHWDASDRIAGILGVTLAEIAVSAPSGVTESVWITALVCAHLSIKQKAQQSQWELMVQKAMDFVRAACQDADAVMATANSMLTAKMSD